MTKTKIIEQRIAERIDRRGTMKGIEKRINDLKSQIEKAEDELRALNEQLRDAMIKQSSYKVDQIITDRHGEEAKIVDLDWGYGGVRPIAVYRKKSGGWGTRQYKLYSWDLPPKD